MMRQKIALFKAQLSDGCTFSMTGEGVPPFLVPGKPVAAWKLDARTGFLVTCPHGISGEIKRQEQEAL